MNQIPKAEEVKSEDVSAGSPTAVNVGSYRVKTHESKVNWAGKKPLIEGYINKGSFEVKEGNIETNNEVTTGEFIIDMNTLSVSDTPTKPGQESVLEGHLKGNRWFDVEIYPEAKFVILKALPRSNEENQYLYDITGELTMKGQTHELTFPANVYVDNKGDLHAEAKFEFDRTEWGITFGSGSFFDNLADNVIDDMVTLSFDLVAEKQ